MKHLHLEVTPDEAEIIVQYLQGRTGSDLRDKAEQLAEKIRAQVQNNDGFMESALEFRQVCALLVQDVEMTYELAHSKHPPDAEYLLKRIDHLHAQKDEMITDREKRESRYNAMKMLFGLTQR